jgi:hypothetical protein
LHTPRHVIAGLLSDEGRSSLAGHRKCPLRQLVLLLLALVCDERGVVTRSYTIRRVRQKVAVHFRSTRDLVAIQVDSKALRIDRIILVEEGDGKNSVVRGRFAVRLRRKNCGRDVVDGAARSGRVWLVVLYHVHADRIGRCVLAGVGILFAVLSAQLEVILDAGGGRLVNWEAGRKCPLLELGFSLFVGGLAVVSVEEEGLLHLIGAEPRHVEGQFVPLVLFHHGRRRVADLILGIGVRNFDQQCANYCDKMSHCTSRVFENEERNACSNAFGPQSPEPCPEVRMRTLSSVPAFNGLPGFLHPGELSGRRTKRWI